jgi:DNA-binding NarL/FixJ family response regulator
VVRFLVIDQDADFSAQLVATLSAHGLQNAGVFQKLPLPCTSLPVHVHVIIMGVSFDRPQELQNAREFIRLERPEEILMLVDRAECAVLKEFIRGGVRGCALKTDSPAEWMAGMQTVARHELFVSSSLAPILLQHVLNEGPGWHQSGLDALTDRELRVFELMGTGLTTSEIAVRLGVSAKTVESHREKIKHRLGFTDVPSLLHFSFIWAQRHSVGSAKEKESLAAALKQHVPAPTSIIQLPLGESPTGASGAQPDRRNPTFPS